MSRIRRKPEGWRKWEEHRMGCFSTGKDLKTWRLRLGLLMGEVAALLGMHQTTISKAEKAKNLSAGVKRGMTLLQEAIEAREIDIDQIIANRKHRGRPMCLTLC